MPHLDGLPGPAVAARRTFLLYIHGLDGGGAERVWAVLTSGLATRGHRVILAVDHHAQANCPMVDKRVEVRLVGPGHGRSIRELARLLRDERPDAVIAATSASNFKLAAAKVLALWRGATVITYHGFWEHRTGWLGWLGVIAMPVLSRFTDRTVGVSDGLTRSLIERWWASPSRTLRIYNPIAVVPPDPSPTRASLAQRDEVVLAVGRLIKDKDYSTALRAFSMLARPQARLVILGTGPEQSLLESEARSLGIANRVEFAGYKVAPWAYYGAARCFLHTACQEAFGNIIVEALAYGLPVVATDCNGPREILAWGRYGTIAPVGDAAALAAALDRNLTDPGDPAARIARAAEFSADVGIAAYEALVETILAERRVGSGKGQNWRERRDLNPRPPA